MAESLIITFRHYQQIESACTPVTFGFGLACKPCKIENLVGTDECKIREDCLKLQRWKSESLFQSSLPV